MLSMKKVILILFFIFSFLNIQSVSAKTQKWDFEVQSVDKDLIKCIKVIDVKSKRSALSTLGNMGWSDTGFIVRLQNKCSEEIKGTYEFKILDKDGFIVDDKYEEFRIGRKGISKQTFKIYMHALSWGKVKKVTKAQLDFSFDIEINDELQKQIEKLKKVIYGQN